MLYPRVLFALLLFALPSYAQQAPAGAATRAAQVRSVPTPDFTGKTMAEVNALNVVPGTSAALFAGVTTQGDSGGVVVSQSPAAKTPVYPGRSRLAVTLGAKKPSLLDQIVGQLVTPRRRAIVPDVRNRTLADATTMLRAAHLNPATSGYSGGVVAQQSPLPRAFVAFNSSVQLTFAPPQAVVPSLYGLTLEAAETLLQRSYLRSGAVTGDRATSIVTQSIQPGTQVPQNTAIDIGFRTAPPPPAPTPGYGGQAQQQQPEVETVPQPVQVFVPELAKLTREQAIDTLTAVDLVAQPAGPENGVVNSQSPAAGAAVDTGTSVGFTLAVPTVVVPSVIGDPESNARARLQVFGLAAEARNTADLKAGVAHLVVAQLPAANTEAAVGATVILVIGNAAAPAPEPAWWERLQPWVLPSAAVLLGLLGFGAWKLTHRPARTGTDDTGKTPAATGAFTLASRPAPSRIATLEQPEVRFTITLRNRAAAARCTTTHEPAVTRKG